MTVSVFIEAFDVLFFRNNRLFGDPGSFGETMTLPWPSVAAGAIRSALLAHKNLPLKARGGWEGEDRELGTPDRPGSFTLTGWQPARCLLDGRIERIYPLPADLIVAKDEENSGLSVRVLRPTRLSEGLRSSYSLPFHPVLAERERSKSESGLWLCEAGWKAYLAGETPATSQLVRQAELWAFDTRIGVGLDAAKRAAAEGRLFTVQALAPRMSWVGEEASRFEVGYVADLEGVSLPEQLTLRLGGDGRAAVAQRIEAPAPEPDYAEIARARCCRLVLTSPGLFEHGWLPTGANPNVKRDDGAMHFELHGVAGWIVAAAVPRHEVVSGWDLAQWQPKAAQRAAPAGSVYWLELDDGVSADALRKLAERALWPQSGEDAARRAEGFNRVALALWRNDAINPTAFGSDNAGCFDLASPGSFHAR